ncbi:MAG: hypothetical protein IK065_00295 [Neisseriaceae bacterium]|nr:hypothetical protein [Neisseriaceae bacterium]
MKNHALLIDVDSVRHSFAILKAIVEKYQKCKIFYLGFSPSVFDYDWNKATGNKPKYQEFDPKTDAEAVAEMLDEYMGSIEIEIDDKDTSEKERQELQKLHKEINRLKQKIGIINSEYIKFPKRLAIEIFEIKQLDDQALILLWFVAIMVFWNVDFLIAPLNTPVEKAIKYYIEDYENAGGNSENASYHEAGLMWKKDYIQAINTLTDDLEFAYLTHLWGECNHTALFYCADKEIFEYIKNLPENNQLLFNRPYDYYYKPVVDYSDEILLDACPCDGVYIGSYSKQ